MIAHTCPVIYGRIRTPEQKCNITDNLRATHVQVLRTLPIDGIPHVAPCVFITSLIDAS